MYIKQIIIDGFKSYRERTVVEFDPKHNVIVGGNGSGKSSLLLAIQCLLCKEYIPLKKEQRQGLLNNISQVKSASVEIIFDNSDKRLPTYKESISLKRMIFLKSDQFLLDGHVISITDILQFLDAAGFSRSNPHYIVKQGEITEFALRSKTRLQLLHQIAGSGFYKQHKKAISITFNAIQKKMEIIRNMLDTIDEKERSLKKDAKEFEEYENLHKQQSVIQFIIHERIINDNTSYLEKLKNKELPLSKIHMKLKSDLQKLQEDIKMSSKILTKFKKRDKSIQDEKKLLELEEQKLLEEKNKLSIEKAVLSGDMKQNNEICQKIDGKLQELNNIIDEKKKNLQKIQSQCEKKLVDEETVKAKLDLNERDRQELCRKRGRGSQFKNKEERDLWINQELTQLEKQIADKNIAKLQIEKDIKNEEKEYGNLEKEIELEMTVLIDQEKKLKDFRAEHNNLKGKKDELLVLCHELYKEDKTYSDQLRSLKEIIAKLDRTLKSIYGRTIDGKSSVQKVLEIFKDNENMRPQLVEYHGLVVDNFDCKPELFKAVEETAGKQLFYHIVETREFGTEILKEMNRHKFSGEVTFLPLVSLEITGASYNKMYPTNKESIPLISQLTYDSKHEKVFKRIFGRTLICPSLEDATIFAKKYDFEFVTFQGDKATSKGLVKGGHFHNLHSPIKIQKEIIDVLNEISLINEKVNSIKEKMEKNRNDISTCISEQQNIEVKISKTSKTINDIKSRIDFKKKDLDLKCTSIITKKNNLKEYERQLHVMLASQKSFNDELCQDMIENLSIHDQQQIENLNDSITQLKIKLRKIINERNKLECEKNDLERELNTKLICQKDELEKQKTNMSLEKIQESLNVFKDELERNEAEILKNKDYCTILDEKINKLQEQQKKQASKKEELQLDENKLLKDLAEVSKQLEKVTSKIDEVNNTIAKSSKKKSEICIPNKNLYEKFNEKDQEKLSKILRQINAQLKPYHRINKQSLVQFKEFSNQKILLQKRKEEIDSAYIAAQDLINALDVKKCETIEFMFNQISKNFTDIFKKLVPTGNAYLVMKTANDTETASESIGDDDNLIGIDITATFTKSSKTTEIHNLSGGQKSLLSLALIFAVQKCNPAPLYLFDEIDQALDFDYKEAVTKMILELSQNAQFITISLRPEFIQEANKFHQITFHNNSSQVKTITLKEATSLLKARKVA